MDIKPIKFAYDTKAVSEEAFRQHMVLYGSYADSLNACDPLIYGRGESRGASPKAESAMFRGLKSGETASLNGLILHEEYFRGMTAEPGSPGAKTLGLLNAEFGGLESFISKFAECAEAARGWCVLAWEQRTKKMRILMQDAHEWGVVTSAFPLLVLDMYEHAYYLDYKTDKRKYIGAFIGSVNWAAVEKRVERVPIDLA